MYAPSYCRPAQPSVILIQCVLSWAIVDLLNPVSYSSSVCSHELLSTCSTQCHIHPVCAPMSYCRPAQPSVMLIQCVLPWAIVDLLNPVSYWSSVCSHKLLSTCSTQCDVDPACAPMSYCRPAQPSVIFIKCVLPWAIVDLLNLVSYSSSVCSHELLSTCSTQFHIDPVCAPMCYCRPAQPSVMLIQCVLPWAIVDLLNPVSCWSSVCYHELLSTCLLNPVSYWSSVCSHELLSTCLLNPVSYWSSVCSPAIVDLPAQPSVILIQCVLSWAIVDLLNPVWYSSSVSSHELLSTCLLNPVWCWSSECPHRAIATQPSVMLITCVAP